jgi:predicted O-methyltransferase YrrM
MHFYVFDELAEIRSTMLRDDRKLNVLDLGAGSRKGNLSKRSISDIARISSSPEVTSQVLFRLINHYGLKKQIEIGSSLGLNSLYLAGCSSVNELTTLEGSPEIAKIARENFAKASNINLVEGEFSETLPGVLASYKSIDFAFVDGNHQEEPTWEYYEELLKKVHPGAVVVFDDIHWSPGMERVWKRIVNDSRNTLTIDWYRLGFVFFRDGIAKQHFVLKQRP